jgi:hypothetical protein
MEFKIFYFEGNLRWGYMRTPEDIALLLKYYPYEDLRKAQKLRDSEDHETPSFGFYGEYDGQFFGDWIDENKQQEYFE